MCKAHVLNRADRRSKFYKCPCWFPAVFDPDTGLHVKTLNHFRRRKRA